MQLVPKNKDNVQKEKEYNEALEYFSATKETPLEDIRSSYIHKAKKCHPDIFRWHVRDCKGNKDCLQELYKVCAEGAREIYTINSNMYVIKHHDDIVVDSSQTHEESVPLSGAQIDDANLAF